MKNHRGESVGEFSFRAALCFQRPVILFTQSFILMKIKRDFFSTIQHSYFGGVPYCENSEVQIAVFSQLSVNKNS